MLIQKNSLIDMDNPNLLIIRGLGTASLLNPDRITIPEPERL